MSVTCCGRVDVRVTWRRCAGGGGMCWGMTRCVLCSVRGSAGYGWDSHGNTGSGWCGVGGGGGRTGFPRFQEVSNLSKATQELGTSTAALQA